MLLHTIKKIPGIVAPAVLSACLLFAFVDSSIAQESTVMVLPPMTVFGIKNADSSYTQTSEIEWDNDNDPTIFAEHDGSYTASATTNSYSLKTLLASLGSPTVNLDFAYAANSISMTADGKSRLSTLLEAIAYLDKGVTLEVIPTLSDQGRENNQLMQRRLDALRKIFARSTQVNISVRSPKNLDADQVKSKRSSTWRVQMRRVKLKQP